MVVMTSCAPVAALSQPAIDAHRRPGDQRPAISASGRWMTDGRPVNDEADEHRGHAAEQQLALGADVEQAGPEAEREAEPGKDERRRRGQRLRDGAERAERAVEQGRRRAPDRWRG